MVSLRPRALQKDWIDLGEYGYSNDTLNHTMQDISLRGSRGSRGRCGCSR